MPAGKKKSRKKLEIRVIRSIETDRKLVKKMDEGIAKPGYGLDTSKKPDQTDFEGSKVPMKQTSLYIESLEEPGQDF